ncbi:hypothetical protein ANCCEY_07483 [Ancylostoma ceylanicum]|uniref:Uncharacterized protein n=1 Tax=Ancylostoma ceylanicum TaxID=53326 RepID=A0A0D6M0J6_9BILA|nr:hypothetical protein ANCCEY_07483 [Ancylostoma ceylanicum]
MRSNFVHHIVATAEYPDKEKINEYKQQLRERILNGVSKCNRAMFIFDEADKLPEKLLGNNHGGKSIAKLALSHHQAGSAREDLTLNNFERMLMEAAYNKPGKCQ